MRRSKAITESLAIVFFLSMMVPDDWADSIHLGQVPLGAFVLSGLCFFLLFQLARKPGKVSGWLMGGLFALVATTSWGVVRRNIDTYTLKFFVADVFCLVALLAGHTVSLTRSAGDSARLVSRICLIISGVIVITYIGVFAGFLKPTVTLEGRTYTSSIFNAVGTLLILLPWATVSADRSDGKGRWQTGVFFAIAAGTGIISATRSIIIILVLIAFLYLVLQRRRFGGAFLLRLSLGAGVVALPLVWSLTRVGTLAFERLSDTQLGDEARSEEVSVWWSQTNDDLLVGQGMGSRFISNVVVNEDPMSSAPHVGIFTFLMKGGILLFLGYALLPMAVAAYVLFSPRYAATQRGAAASVITFVALACLSGGWSPLYLFAYGWAISSMTPQRRTRTSSSLRYLERPVQDAHRQVLPAVGE